MSWLYSRALVEEYLEASSSGGGQSAPSSGTSMPQAYLHNDKTTDTWNPSRFGVTCERLTGSHGADVLTSFLEAFPVKILVRPAAAPELKEADPACGWRWPGSLARFCPVSSLWKTRQCSLLGGLESFSETWPRWGTMRDGEFWERTTPEHPTSGIGSGSWPTPTASLGLVSFGFATMEAKERSGRRKSGAQIGSSLSWDRRVIPFLSSKNWMHPILPETLMGWPVGWTDCEPLGTDKYQQWRRLHGEF